jgi:hypothetical protein
MRKLIAVLPAAMVLFALSCQKAPNSASTQPAADTVTTEQQALQSAEEALPAYSPLNHGYSVRVNAGLYAVENDTGAETDVAKWKASIPLGEKFDVISGSRKAVFQGSSYSFVKIRRDMEQEGYVIESNLAVGGSLGVVIDESSRMYNNPKNVDVSNSVLPNKTLLVWFPETEKDGFVEFKAYDKYPISNLYIKKTGFSVNNSDIQSAILLRTALSLDKSKDGNRITALLETAQQEYPDSSFREEIRQLVNPGASVTIETRSSSISSMEVIDDSVNVRDNPNTAGSRVVGQLERGAEVTVSVETVNTYTVGGENDRWYYIVSPLEGWIFGAFLASVE